ncbi:MAG: FIST C-terminal domain-containing protein [Candidatus Omnitrophota bacterium]
MFSQLSLWLTLFFKVFIIQPMRVGIGVSTELDHLKAVKEAVEEAIIQIKPDNIDFALLFTTEEFSHSLVLQTTADLIGRIPLLGSSSSIIISQNGPLKHGLILVLFKLNEGSYFNAACVKDITINNTLSSGEELGGKLLYGCKNVHRDLGVIFSNTNTGDYSSLVTGIQEKLGRGFPLVGASLPKRIDHAENHLYSGSEILNNAVCGVLWGGKLNFSLGIEHGWQPLGKPRYATRTQVDTVNEIDGLPAVNLYKEYFGKETLELNRELKRISVFYPLGIAVSGNKEYLLRSVISIKNDGSLLFRGEVPEGSMVRLMISSKDSCLAAAAKAAKTALDNARGKKIKFALVLNSLSRYALLGRQAAQEIRIVRETLGSDVPFAGIYTSAEQAPLNSANYNLGKTYFHNNSIAILTITE